MYTNFYNLKSKPFTLLPDPEYLFLSHKHKTALVYLEYGLMDQAGFTVVTGEIGTGKTTLIKYFLNKLDDSTKVAYIFNTNITPQQFVKAILQELEIRPSTEDKSEILDALNQFLIHEYALRHKVILIIDEAQNLSLSTLEEIRMLSNLQTEKDHLLQIVLVGQPSLKNKLRHPHLKQFSQRVTVNYHLIPLDLEETRDYIHHRLKVSQAQDINLFTEKAINTIYHSSKGIPRLINILCDASLVYGFAEELTRIDEQIVEQVIADKRQGGIFGVEEDLKTVELPDLGNSSSDGLEYRVSILEQEVSDLQQKVLSALYNFSQFMGNRGDSQMVNNAVIDKLERMLTEERRAKEHLILECDRLKKQADHHIKINAELEKEIARLKQTPQAPSPNPKKSLFSFLWLWIRGKR